jgi:hypothetical protein
MIIERQLVCMLTILSLPDESCHCIHTPVINGLESCAHIGSSSQSANASCTRVMRVRARLSQERFLRQS